MSALFDAKMTGGNSADGLNQEATAAATISSTGMTVGVNARLIVVVAHWQSASGVVLSGISGTWNAVALTAGPTVNHTAGGGGPENRSAIFYLVAPASGNKTLALSWTGSADCYMSCVSFTGTNTTTPIVIADNVTGTTGTTVTITSATNDATVAVWGTNGSPPTVNFTKIFAEAPLNPGAGASYTTGGASNGHTFTGAGGTNPAWAGVHILGAVGGGGGSSSMSPALMMQFKREGNNALREYDRNWRQRTKKIFSFGTGRVPLQRALCEGWFDLSAGAKAKSESRRQAA